MRPLRAVVFVAIFGILSVCQVVYGQFIPYSQYNNAPLLTNPAGPSLTDYTQITAHYHRSRVASYDVSSVSFIHPFYHRSNGLRYGGVGVNVISQQAGPGGIYKITGATGTLAYTIHLSKNHHIGAGVAGGVINKRIDVSRITTESQYSLGVYDPSLNNGEDLQSNSVTKPVVNAGLYWVLTGANDREKASLGVAAYSMNKPSFDLLSDAPADDMTYIVSGEIVLLTRGRITLAPTFRYIYQIASTANIGARISYAPASDNEFSASVWYKTTQALVFSAQYNYKAFVIGASTDLSVIASGQDANINNAVEICLGWRVNRKARLKPRTTSAPAEKPARPKPTVKSSSAPVSPPVQTESHLITADDSSTADSKEIKSLPTKIKSLPTTPVIYFDLGSAEVPADSRPLLEDLTAALKSHPEYRLKITGHSCTQGDQSVNKQISYERAEAIAIILIGNGASEDQLRIIGMGDRKPVGSNHTKAGRQKNRRVEFEWIRK